jgi:hypothetical protein
VEFKEISAKGSADEDIVIITSVEAGDEGAWEMSCGAEEEAVDDVVDKTAYNDPGDGEGGNVGAEGSEFVNSRSKRLQEVYDLLFH